MRFRNGETEHAEVGKPVDDIQRHKRVGEMPGLRPGSDLVAYEAAHLDAHVVERGIVMSRIAERGAAIVEHERRPAASSRPA
jgi:hypothetical protein